MAGNNMDENIEAGRSGVSRSELSLRGDFMDMQRVHNGQAGPPLSLEWQNLVFSIGDKQILKGITGLIEPGHVTGVMGPSGCGKTTLLNVLSGRQRTHGRERTQGTARQVQLQGSVSVSGRQVKVHDFRSKVAYVFQDNALPEHETSAQCLEFSAFLRLPAEVTPKERRRYVDHMLKRLHLEDCADTPVGSALQKGLSGGEQKRTAVGVELISNPKVVFLDEPLSGLDSFNAYTLVESLKELASAGVPVLLTLHQPSSEIFAMLDDVVILHDGEVCFHGPADHLLGHFQQLGFSCPPNYNPPDRVLWIIQQEPEQVVRGIKDRWLESSEYQALLSRIERASDWAQVDNAELSGTETSSSSDDGQNFCSAPDDIVSNRHPKGCCATLGALMMRDLRGTKRTWKVIVTQALIGNLLVALVYGVLFYHKVEKEEVACSSQPFDSASCQRAFLVHFAVLSMVSINVMFAAHAWATEVLQQERATFLRERAGGYYQVFPYILSKTLFEVPLIFAQCIVMLMGAYWLVGLHGNFIVLALEMEALALTSSSLMYCLSAASSTRAQASGLAVLPQILQFGFSGVLLPISEIPVFLQWIKWLCPLYYGLGLLSVTEFQYLYREQDSCQVDACPGVQLRIAALKVQDIEERNFLWPDLVMCGALFLGLRILAMVILWWKSRYVL